MGDPQVIEEMVGAAQLRMLRCVFPDPRDIIVQARLCRLVRVGAFHQINSSAVVGATCGLGA